MDLTAVVPAMAGLGMAMAVRATAMVARATAGGPGYGGPGYGGPGYGAPGYGYGAPAVAPAPAAAPAAAPARSSSASEIEALKRRIDELESSQSPSTPAPASNDWPSAPAFRPMSKY